MKSRFMVFASAAVLASAPALFAEDAETSEQPAEQSAEGAEALAGAQQKQPQDKPFYMLPLCRVMEGGAEVLRPGAEQWEALVEGKFYPLGCAYRTTAATSRLTIQFGRVSSVVIEGIASFGTRAQQVGLKDRTLILRSGTIKVVLPRSMPAGLVKVTAPGFTASDLAGESSFSYESTGDGDEATVRCLTGALALEGRHFRIPAMRAANEVKIRTSQDQLFTGLYGTSGDYVAKLDQGIVTTHDVETGKSVEEDRKLDWHLSPRTAVRIHRAKPAIGERLSVTVMTFDESGALVNRCAFAEGLAALNTGEQGEKALAVKEEQAKRAMESADAVTTEAASEETSTEEAKETNETTTEESSEE